MSDKRDLNKLTKAELISIINRYRKDNNRRTKEWRVANREQWLKQHREQNKRRRNLLKIRKQGLN